MPCTTVLVGKNASNDRSTMIARTDDGHFDEKKLIVVTPKQQKRKYKSVLSHVTVELPEEELLMGLAEELLEEPAELPAEPEAVRPLKLPLSSLPLQMLLELRTILS